MLECKNLTCVREDRVLFKNINFTLAAGDILQVEGPNGIGKSSLFRMLVGLSPPYSGCVQWQQQDITVYREQYYQNMLYLGHKSGVKPELTALENLQLFHQLARSEKQYDAWEVLTSVGLAGYEDVFTAQLSAGQQRRVALAKLWLSDSPLWILDEPFTAIDKQGVKVIEELLLRHAKQGGMVILTTHQDLAIQAQHYKKLLLEKPPIEEQYV